MARFPRHSVPASLWRIPAGPVAEVSCRTIATAPAWMRGAILPGAPQATLQPNHTLPLFLAGVSGAQGNTAHTHPPRPCAQAFRWSSLPAGTQSASLLLHFGHRLATMAGMAKALEIAAVREHCPVSAVRLDVVHFRGRRPVSAPGTFPAKGLAKELSRPQVLRPLWSQVHPVPGLGRIAAAVLGAVEITIAASDQGRTPRMSAWTQRLLCHGLSPPGKTKSLHQHVRPLRIMWHRLIGTGTRRYSRWTLFRRACNTPSSSWLWSLN